jgi:metalloendopeptidase OMA1, mitochondrial
VLLPFCYDENSLQGTELDKWVELLFQSSRNLGQDWRKPDRCKQLMEEAGFVEIYTETHRCPINQWGAGKWSKENGVILARIISDGLLAISMQVFMRGLGWTYEQVEGFLAGVERNLQDPNIRVYANLYVLIRFELRTTLLII